MTTTNHPDNLTDIGPAPAAPPWCEPGYTPSTESVIWSRDFHVEHDDICVYLMCTDNIEGGRIVRSAPSLFVNTGDEPITTAAARRLAAAILNAADVLDGPTDTQTATVGGAR
jgi:hypothetical protein